MQVVKPGDNALLALLPRKRELLKPYPMRLRESQIAELRELEARGVMPAEFIRAALDDALRRVRESGESLAP